MWLLLVSGRWNASSNANLTAVVSTISYETSNQGHQSLIVSSKQSPHTICLLKKKKKKKKTQTNGSAIDKEISRGITNGSAIEKKPFCFREGKEERKPAREDNTIY
jgi:hypothetical protein